MRDENRVIGYSLFGLFVIVLLTISIHPHYLPARPGTGSIHTVPFRDVGTALNYTRDFSNVNLNIDIACGESVDDVMMEVEDLGKEMAGDEVLGTDIITPLEVQGVNGLDDFAVVIRARMRVTAGTQWSMKRKFNHRMKNRLGELSIKIPFPQQTITFGVDKK